MPLKQILDRLEKKKSRAEKHTFGKTTDKLLHHLSPKEYWKSGMEEERVNLQAASQVADDLSPPSH